MRILLFNDHGTGGGAETYVDILADALKDEGEDVIKLCRVRGGEDWMVLGGDHDTVKLFDYFTSHTNYYDRSDRILSKFKPDIVHVNEVQLYYADLLVKIARRRKARLVFTTHNYGYVCPTSLYVKIPEMIPCEKPYPNTHCPTCLLNFRSGFRHKLRDFSKVLYSMSRWSHFLRSFDAIVSPSRRFARLLIESAGVNAYHLWNPVPESLLKDELTLNSGSENTVFFAGRLVYVKGAHLLPSIANMLDGAAVVEAIGSGPLSKYLSTNGPNSLKYRGYVSEEEKKKLLDECKVSVVPSLWSEMFPTTVIESFCRARPVVAFDLGGQAEQIHESGGGLTAKPFDLEELVEKIRFLLVDGGLTTRMGLQARKWAVSRLDPQDYAKSLLRIYKGVN